MRSLNDPKVRLSTDPREVEPVNRVAERIIEATKDSKYAEFAEKFVWEVSVIKDDKTKNAFALPSGKIGVYTGIFPVAKNEAGLAAVLGHEMVHALARHGAERLSHGLVARIVLTVISIGLSFVGLNPGVNDLAMQGLSIGTQMGFLLPYSRKHESEADYIGLLLAARAGYDPQEAVGIWQRMDQLAEEEIWEYVSTHPSHETRIEDLQQWMPEALAIYNQVPHAPVSELPPITVPPTEDEAPDSEDGV